MKTLKLTLVAAVVLAFSHILYAGPTPFIEPQAGFLAWNAAIAPVYGVHAGALTDHYEFSGGYWAAIGLPSDRLNSYGLNLHTFSAEVYRVFRVPSGYSVNGYPEYYTSRLSLKIGGGLGLTIPNLDGGAFETADNGHSWVVGGGANYTLSQSMDLGFSVKGFFFTTDTHITTFGVHDETLYADGIPVGSVEVIDEFHHNDVVNFNSVLFALSLRWR